LEELVSRREKELSEITFTIKTQGQEEIKRSERRIMELED
jgi:hypothetical protein